MAKEKSALQSKVEASERQTQEKEQQVTVCYNFDLTKKDSYK